jgi:hypothetical protein
MPETIRHGETGLLVPPRDPEALAAAILELLDDRPRALAMARAGRALMLDRFQISGTAAGIAALYDRHFASAELVACLRYFGSGFRSAAPGGQGATSEDIPAISERGATPPAGMPRPEGATEIAETGH